MTSHINKVTVEDEQWEAPTDYNHLSEPVLKALSKISYRKPRTKKKTSPIPDRVLESARTDGKYFHLWAFQARQYERMFDYITDELLVSKRTPQQIAETIGRPVSTVNRWLSGNPNFSQACELLYGIYNGRINFLFENSERLDIEEIEKIIRKEGKIDYNG